MKTKRMVAAAVLFIVLLSASGAAWAQEIFSSTPGDFKIDAKLENGMISVSIAGRLASGIKFSDLKNFGDFVTKDNLCNRVSNCCVNTQETFDACKSVADKLLAMKIIPWSIDAAQGSGNGYAWSNSTCSAVVNDDSAFTCTLPPIDTTVTAADQITNIINSFLSNKQPSPYSNVVLVAETDAAAANYIALYSSSLDLKAKIAGLSATTGAAASGESTCALMPEASSAAPLGMLLSAVAVAELLRRRRRQ